MRALTAGLVAVAAVLFCTGASDTEAARIELGRRLFYEADLSIDGAMACSTCHEQHRAFADGNRTHGGVRGALGKRNVMGLANVAAFRSLTWRDPHQDTLERQVFVPLMGDDPVEMGMSGQEKAIVERLSGDGCYPRQFLAAFPEDKGEISSYTAAKAIAAFERTLVSLDAPYDRYRRGEVGAISDRARRGARAFADAGCATCHAGNLFTDADGKDVDASFHHIGANGPDRGLAEITEEAADVGRFRTPSLRNVALTGPYLHDGSAATLPDAIRAHKQAQGLASDDMEDIVTFLQSLTDQTFVSDPRFSLPPPCR